MARLPPGFMVFLNAPKSAEAALAADRAQRFHGYYSFFETAFKG